MLTEEVGEVAAAAPLLLFTGAGFLAGSLGEGVEGVETTPVEVGDLLKVSGGGCEKLVEVVGVETGVETTTPVEEGVVTTGVVLLLPSRSLTLRSTASNSRNSFSSWLLVGAGAASGGLLTGRLSPEVPGWHSGLILSVRMMLEPCLKHMILPSRPARAEASWGCA